MNKKISFITTFAASIFAATSAIAAQVYFEPDYCSSSALNATKLAEAGARNKATDYCSNRGKRLDYDSVTFIFKEMSCSNYDDVGRGATIDFWCK